jgi:hypothetical protein
MIPLTPELMVHRTKQYSPLTPELMVAPNKTTQAFNSGVKGFLCVCFPVCFNREIGFPKFLGMKAPDFIPALLEWPKRVYSSRGEADDIDVEEPSNRQTQRLDCKSICQYHQEKGAAATYLSSACKVVLATGEMATMVYVIPKYILRYASDRPEDMQACLQLALAETSEMVEAACASKETGAYDIVRHMNLRRAFTVVYVTEKGDIVDTHKHFMVCGGHSEHQLFVSELQGKTLTKPIPKGPLHSMPGKRRGHGKPKRSEALKQMLGPPALPDGKKPSLPIVPTIVPIMLDSDIEHLPGAAMVSEKNVLLHCQWAAKCGTRKCLAKTGSGKSVSRCQLFRKKGNFCLKHYQQAQGSKTAQIVLESLKTAFQHAQRWSKRVKQEQADLTLAMALSMEASTKEYKEARARMFRLGPRLTEHKVCRIETAPFGNCQFEAICVTAKLSIGIPELRSQICNYLALFPDTFGSFLAGRFENFQEYLAHMRKDGSWGDHLTLTVAATLLLRPIWVITDTTQDNYLVQVDPIGTISQEEWEPPLLLIHYGELHYDATGPVEELLAHLAKQEKQKH